MNKIYDGKLRVLELCTSFLNEHFSMKWNCFLRQKKSLTKTIPVMNTHAFLFEKFTHILISTNCFLMWKMSNALHKSTNFYKIYLQFLNNLPISSPGTCPNIDPDRDFKSECTHGAGACNTNYYCIMYQIH